MRAQDYNVFCENGHSPKVTASATYNPTGRTQLYHPGACDDGWVLYGRNCYMYGSQHVDWHTADARCRSLGSTLASIHSDVENSFVHYLSGGISTWIGLVDYNTKPDVPEQYQWSDDTATVYTNWAVNCEDPQSKDLPECAPKETVSHWYEFKGNEPAPYVCKKPAKVNTDILSASTVTAIKLSIKEIESQFNSIISISESAVSLKEAKEEQGKQEEQAVRIPTPSASAATAGRSTEL